MEKSLIVFYALNLLVGFFIKSFVVWLRTKVNPYVLGKGDDLQGLVALWFRFVMIGLGLYCSLPWLWPDSIGALRSWPPHYIQQMIGVGILTLSILLMFGSQVSLGDAWRIGIDQNERSELIISGFYKISRNPIFLAMRLQLVGVFLVSPSGLSLLLAGIGELCIQIQVRLEEMYLLRTHGPVYEQYKLRVRRWL